jgi:hypothetical protein
MAAHSDIMRGGDQGQQALSLTLDNVRGLTAVLQAIKPGSKQVCAGIARRLGRRRVRAAPCTPTNTWRASSAAHVRATGHAQDHGRGGEKFAVFVGILCVPWPLRPSPPAFPLSILMWRAGVQRDRGRRWAVHPLGGRLEDSAVMRVPPVRGGPVLDTRCPMSWQAAGCHNSPRSMLTPFDDKSEIVALSTACCFAIISLLQLTAADRARPAPNAFDPLGSCSHRTTAPQSSRSLACRWGCLGGFDQVNSHATQADRIALEMQGFALASGPVSGNYTLVPPHQPTHPPTNNQPTNQPTWCHPSAGSSASWWTPSARSRARLTPTACSCSTQGPRASSCCSELP